jgi:hypothetical protein
MGNQYLEDLAHEFHKLVAKGDAEAHAIASRIQKIVGWSEKENKDFLVAHAPEVEKAADVATKAVEAVVNKEAPVASPVVDKVVEDADKAVDAEVQKVETKNA